MNLDTRLMKFLGSKPEIHQTVFIAESAEIIGDVRLKALVSIWPQCVLRADINRITINEGSNLQDGVIIHLSDDHEVTVGQYCTIGHGAILHACEIKDETLIGMRATILDGAVIGAGSIIGAHTLVTKDTVIPEGSLVLGTPGKVIRPVTPEERKDNRYWAEKYIKLASAHRQMDQT